VRQIDYNNSAFTLRFEFPLEWDLDSLTGVNIDITNLDGESLLDATAATLYTATTTNAAGAVGDSTVTLANDASAPSPGDRLRISASAGGPSEEIEVESYNSSTKVATLRRELRFAHTTGTAVKGLFCTYNLDTSTVATWTKALQVVLRWSPGGSDDLPVKERGEVSASYFAFPDFSQRFEVRYPREHRIALPRLKSVLEEAKLEVEHDLSTPEFHIHRVADSEKVRLLVLKKARLIVLEGTGDKWESERTAAIDEYNRIREIILNQPVWQDENQDDVKDDEEMLVGNSFWGKERGL